MLGTAALGAPGADGRNVRLEALLDGAVGLGGELHERVEGYLHPGALALVDVVEVGEDAADHGLVRDDDDVLGPLELHDDGFEADDDVAVRLAPAVPVVVLVVVASLEVLRVLGLDLRVRHAVADTRLELVEGLPLQRLPPHLLRQVLRRLDCPFQRRRPDGQRLVCGYSRFAHNIRQCPSVRLPPWRQVRVPADLGLQVVFRFAMLDSGQWFGTLQKKETGGGDSVGWRVAYPRQPDASRFDVEVLQVVDQSRG